MRIRSTNRLEMGRLRLEVRLFPNQETRVSALQQGAQTRGSFRTDTYPRLFLDAADRPEGRVDPPRGLITGETKVGGFLARESGIVEILYGGVGVETNIRGPP